MSVVSEIKARIEVDGTPFALIQGAAELASVVDRPDSTPAVFVLAAKEVSQTSPYGTGGFRQRSAIDIAVVIVTDNLSDDQGDAASREIEVLKAYVRSRLVGWQPDAAETPLEHVNGEIVQAAGGTVWFEDVFATETYLEEQIP